MSFEHAYLCKRNFSNKNPKSPPNDVPECKASFKLGEPAEQSKTMGNYVT